jgi:hypothetical protein
MSNPQHATHPSSDPKKEAADLLAKATADRTHLQSTGAPPDKLAAHDKAVNALKAAVTDDDLKKAITAYKQITP